jgi:hypothetical protein
MTKYLIIWIVFSENHQPVSSKTATIECNPDEIKERITKEEKEQRVTIDRSSTIILQNVVKL